MLLNDNKPQSTEKKEEEKKAREIQLRNEQYISTKRVITDSNLKILRSAIILLVEKGYNTHTHTLEARDSIVAKR